MRMSSFSVVWASHPRWPLPPLTSPSHPSTTSTPSAQTYPLHITLLDSSFNPPTLAHLALASHSLPPSQTAAQHKARCLALSIKNADKAQADDESVKLRLEMMRCLAEEMEHREPAEGGTGVLLLDEPIFTRKSSLVKRAIEQRISELTEEKDLTSAPDVRLTFVVGWDTLIRIFDTKYYTSPQAMSASLSQFFSRTDGEGSSFSCARRGDVSPAEEKAFLDRDEVARWVGEGAIELWDLSEDVKEASSTEVRRRVKAGESIAGLVVPGVGSVIEREGLYKA